jgi:uncharacterized protein YvpB
MITMPVPVVHADDLPIEANIEGFTGYAQMHSLTCEARSAADVAAFWGTAVTEDELFNLISRSANPERGFVGNPDDAWGNLPPLSYGVHAPPVAKALRKLGLDAKKGRNLDWDVLRTEIAASRPVIVWVIGQVWAGEPVVFTAEDGSQTLIARFEHTMILTGYTADRVQLFDSYAGIQVSYPLITFLQSWAVLGNQAVFVYGEGCEDCVTPVLIPSATPAPVVSQKTPKNYIVQPGEYLIQLAERFGLDWRTLAEINNINYPWVIYPGQKIKLK